MKNVFKAIGKAAFYFFVYFLIQMAVSFVYGIVLTVNISTEITDETLLAEQLTGSIMEQAMMMTFVSGVVTIIVFWIFFLIRRKSFLKEIAVRPILVKGIFPMILLAAGFNVITSVLLSIIPFPQSWMDSYAANSSAIDNSLIAWLTAVVMAPVVEEVVFRGLIYTRLKKGMPKIAAAIMTSLIFGIVHGTIIWAIYTFIFSMVLIWGFERYQSLAASIVLHLGYNITGMALSLLPEEAGILILFLFAGSIVAVRWAFRRTKEITEQLDFPVFPC